MTLQEKTITELRAYIQWRKEEQTKLYRHWNKDGPPTYSYKYERYQEEIEMAVAEIDRRKEARNEVR